MANTKLKTVSPIIAMEQQTTVFETTATLTGASFTIPANCGGVWCYPSAACHVVSNGAATSTTGHAVAASEPFYIETAKVGTTQIIGDAGSITLTVAYMRGARPAITHAVTRPY